MTWWMRLLYAVAGLLDSVIAFAVEMVALVGLAHE